MFKNINLEEDSQQGSQPQQSFEKQSHIDLRKFISPPNPITKKLVPNNSESSTQDIRNRRFFKPYRFSQGYQQEQLSLQNFYNSQLLIFQKHHNEGKNVRNDTKYAASFFFDNPIDIWEKRKYIGMLKEDDLLEFDSNYESANLFKAFRTDDQQYDLILQNDTNSTGYAQWFNFKVKCKFKDMKIKFNIVNLYKSRSLYEKGMKPLCLSKKNSGQKSQRAAFNVQYYQNQIPTQRESTKKYFTLSFCYEFVQQNDEVQFCHFYPYTSRDCQNFLSLINDNSKIKLKTIGTTALRKPIHIIHCSSVKASFQSNNHNRKKAIVIMGRQHSGQTQSSFLIEEIVNTLIANNFESQFILDKYDVYICPMLNVDGVIVGNYRTNLYGYDLNRYWHSDNQLKIPEVFYFKKFINTLHKKQTISLVLDLHGHSKKLNSFFFGNLYGKNPMLLPFVASTICDMINFKSCSFKEEKTSKSHTARAVLGSTLKESCYVYTFQVSFWGYKKNNRTIPYTIENMKELSRGLTGAIYKVFLQESKEELTLKESVYLKEINKVLQDIKLKDQFEKDSGSDSQAEQLTVKEDFEKTNVNSKHVKIETKQKQIRSKRKETQSKSKEAGTQVEEFLSMDQFIIKPSEVDIFYNSHALSSANYQNKPKIKENSTNSKVSSLPKRIKKSSSSNVHQSYLARQLFLKQQQAFYQLETEKKNQKRNRFSYSNGKSKQFRSQSRKQFLLEKLRIFGGNLYENIHQEEKKEEKIEKKQHNVRVQVPELIDSQKQIMLYSKSEKKQSQKNDRNFNKLNINPHEEFFQKEIRQEGKWKNSKNPKNIQSKKKVHSLFLHKPVIQEFTGFNQKSVDKFKQMNSKQPLKQPIVKIQKMINLTKEVGNEIAKRQNAFQNINRLKGKITALKRQSHERLPEIDSYMKFQQQG